MHTIWPSNIASRTVSQRDHKNGKGFHMCKYIYSISPCGGQKLEIKGMSINWGMAEQVVVHECNGILLCYKKWWTGRLQGGLEIPIWIDAEWKEQNQETFVHSYNHSVQGIFLVDLVLHWNAISTGLTLEAKCLPHPEKELWNLIAEWSRLICFVL